MGFSFNTLTFVMKKGILIPKDRFEAVKTMRNGEDDEKF